jgi:mycothiol synthase
MTLTWAPLANADLADLSALAARCLAADGGLPLVTQRPFLARRFTADGTLTTGARDTHGTLVAAAAVRHQQSDLVRAATVAGLVDPDVRGRGVGARLLDWALGAAATVADKVTVETESLTPAAEALFASRGLRQVFAEDVLRRDLVDPEPPVVPLPGGVMLTEWSRDLADRFFAAYDASFRDRPGFPGWSAEQWIEWLTDDDEFRPDWSLLATDGEAGDVGFVACGEGWIVQVGVRPDWRGRGLGAALVTEALARMRAAGATEALLDVNVNNPAGALYRRLGFASLGRRARFARA